MDDLIVRLIVGAVWPVFWQTFSSKGLMSTFW